MTNLNFIPLGDSALFVRFEERISQEINSNVTSLLNSIESNPFPGLIEVIPAYSGLTIIFDPLSVTADTVISTIRDCSTYEVIHTGPKEITIPVLYGGEYGPDLPMVANHNSISEEKVVSIHTGSVYRVYMMGFTPGFPYLGGMSKEISMPRRAEPRVAIPAGSVAIAGNQTGIYPVKSPGGWQIIGRTPVNLYNPMSSEPFLLSAGMELRFKSIGKEEFEEVLNQIKSSVFKPETLFRTS